MIYKKYNIFIFMRLYFSLERHALPANSFYAYIAAFRRLPKKTGRGTRWNDMVLREVHKEFMEGME